MRDYKYKSERNKGLISQVPGVITCEDYCKWYNLYYIESNTGVVCKLGDVWWDAIGIEYRDHTYQPRSVVEFALKHNLKIGRMSMEAIIYRWRENYYEEGIPLDELPKFEDAIKCVVEDNGIILDDDLVHYEKLTESLYVFDKNQTLNNLCFRGPHGFYIRQWSSSVYKAYDIDGYAVGFIRIKNGCMAVYCPIYTPNGHIIWLNIDGDNKLSEDDIPLAQPLIANTIKHYIMSEKKLDIKIGNTYRCSIDGLPQLITVKDIVKDKNLGVKVIAFNETDTTINALEFHKFNGDFTFIRRGDE